MSNLLVTIAAGESIDYGDLTIPRMYDYARSCGADLMVITQPVFGSVWDATNRTVGGPSFWKLPLIQWFAKQSIHRRMAYVDVDVFIKKGAPSIFRSEPDDGVAMAMDMNSEREAPEWEKWAEEHYPDTPRSDGPPGYFNAGVWEMHLGAAVRLTMEMGLHPSIFSRWFEQDFMNLCARSSGNLRELPKEFNCPVPYMTRDISQGHFLHLCGLPQQEKRAWLLRMEHAELHNETTI